jgi:hypothetical protein
MRWVSIFTYGQIVVRHIERGTCCLEIGDWISDPGSVSFARKKKPIFKSIGVGRQIHCVAPSPKLGFHLRPSFLGDLSQFGDEKWADDGNFQPMKVVNWTYQNRNFKRSPGSQWWLKQGNEAL